MGIMCICDLLIVRFHIATGMMLKVEALVVQMVKRVVAAVERGLLMNLAVAVEDVVCISSLWHMYKKTNDIICS